MRARLLCISGCTGCIYRWERGYPADTGGRNACILRVLMGGRGTLTREAIADTVHLACEALSVYDPENKYRICQCMKIQDENLTKIVL